MNMAKLHARLMDVCYYSYRGRCTLQPTKACLPENCRVIELVTQEEQMLILNQTCPNCGGKGAINVLSVDERSVVDAKASSGEPRHQEPPRKMPLPRNDAGVHAQAARSTP